MSSVYENSCIKLHSGVCLLTSFEGVVIALGKKNN